MAPSVAAILGSIALTAGLFGGGGAAYDHFEQKDCSAHPEKEKCEKYGSYVERMKEYCQDHPDKEKCRVLMEEMRKEYCKDHPEEANCKSSESPPKPVR